MHRIGGIEKEDGTGNISYDPANHQHMTDVRAAKVAGIAADIPPTMVTGDDDADLLMLGWGSTWGAITAATKRARAAGHRVAHAHLTHLNPFPADLGEVLSRHRRVIVPEMNMGQLSRLVRAEFLVDARSVTKVQGSALHRRRALRRHRRRAGLTTRSPSKGAVRSMSTDADTTTTTAPATTKADWTSDQEPRWCPGCGDYSILTAMQLMLPDTDLQPESTVFVSGIGCAARFPYYMNTYGMHSIHGRAPAVATGLAMARPDLDVWVIGGDGDMLSIGGNHLIHAMRRNVDLTILLFNNQIYGLTKGQYSPTSEVGKVTKSTPMGSLDEPFNPVSIALGAEASFVARTHDMDRKHMQAMFRRAHDHKGAALVEIFQNCNVFNDGAFSMITKKDKRDAMLIDLEHGKPIRFGADGEFGVVHDASGGVTIAEVAEVGEDAVIVHDETVPRSLARLRAVAVVLGPLRAHPGRRVPCGRTSRVHRHGVPAAGGVPAAQRPGRPPRVVAFPADLGSHLSAAPPEAPSAWVLDLDGVIWLGDQPITGSAAACRRLDLAGAAPIYVTNMSRLTVSEQEAKLARHGIDAAGRVVTSAMAAASVVGPSERAFVVGGTGVIEALEARDVDIVGDAGTCDVVVVGMDPGFDYDQMKVGHARHP